MGQMGKTFRGLDKKQREKFSKSRKQRQEKRRVQEDKPAVKTNKESDEKDYL
jgi:hypothetical protein